MRSLLLVLASLISISTYAGSVTLVGDKKSGSVDEMSAGSYRRVRAELYDAKEIVLTLSTDYKTKDGCNSFSLTGGLREILPEAGVTSFVKDYLADVGVMGTEMACNSLPTERTIPLQSKSVRLAEEKAGAGIRLDVLVPENLDLKIEIVK